jgi:hypothetical protein
MKKSSRREHEYNPTNVDELRDKLYRKNRARYKAKLRRLQRIRKAKTREGDNRQ